MEEVEPGDLVIGKTYFATNIVFFDIYPARQGGWSRQDELNKKYIVTVTGKRYDPMENQLDWRIDLNDIKQIRGFGKIMHSNPIPNIDTGGKWTEINVYSGWRGLTLLNFKEEEPKFYERGAQMAVSVSHVVNKTKNELTKQIRKLRKKLREIDELKLKHPEGSKLNEEEQTKLGNEERLRTLLIAAEAEEEKKKKNKSQVVVRVLPPFLRCLKISRDTFLVLVGFKAWVEEENERRAVENAVRRIVENAVRRVEKENLVESVVNQGVDGNKFYLARALILRRFHLIFDNI